MSPDARPEFDALAVPLEGLVLVEASAGTGKTHGICSLLLRALALEGIDVGELFVVTFTEAATRELRDRIGQRLREALRGLDAAPEGSELARMIGAARARGVPQALLRRRLRDALVRLDEAWVHTIHGLCLRWLTEFAFEGGGGFDEPEVEDGQGALRSVLRDIWRERVVAAAPADGRRVQHAFADVATLAQSVMPLLRLPVDRWRDEASNLPAAQQALDQVAARAREMRDCGAFDELLAMALARGKALNQGSYSERQLRGMHAGLLDSFAEGAVPDGKEKAFERLLRPVLCKGQNKDHHDPDWPPPLPVFEWLERHPEDWKTALRRYRAALLADIGAEAAARLEARAQRGVLSHDQVIQRVRAGLAAREGAWARALRARFRLGIVDEFQDTDGLQYDIFRALLEGEGGSARGLVLVGDPKQAIYGFRGGDVHAYRRALEDAGPGRVHTLGYNYRSEPALVDAVNALFSFTPDAFLHDFIPFRHACVPGERQAREIGAPPIEPGLVVWTGAATGSKGEAGRLIEQAVCAEILQLLRGPLAAGRASIAVLTRSNVQARSVAEQLVSLGIDAARRDDSSVFESEAAEDLRLCLHALARPRDRGVARAALATRLLGVPMRRLGAGEDAVQEELAALAHAGSVLDADGPAAALLPLLRAAAARTAGEAAMPRYLADGLHAIEWMGARWPGLTGIDALAQLLDEAVARAHAPGTRVPEDEARRPESDRAPVQVMTVHRAKGLQFDVVFAPWLCFGLGVGEDRLGERVPVQYHDAGGALQMDLGSEGLCEHAREQALDACAEEIRLAYVALTRAKVRCYTAWFDVATRGGSAASPMAALLHAGDGARRDGLQRKGDRNAFGEAVARRLDEWARGSGGGVVVQPFPDGSATSLGGARPVADPAQVPQFAGGISPPRRVHSFTALFGAAEFRSTLDTAEGPEFGGRRLGDCAHAALERIDFDQWPQPAQLAVLRNAVSRHGYPQAVYEWLRERFDLLLSTPLLDGLVLGEVGAGDRLAELEFFFPVASARLDGLQGVLAAHGLPDRIGTDVSQQRLRGLMRGFVDLVVRRDGVYYVLDYKTNWLGPDPRDYAPSRLAIAMREHRYDLQYLIYLVALHRHLRHRLGTGYDATRQLGGVAYVFLRGLEPGSCNGIHVDRPSTALVEALDRWFHEAAA